MRNDGFFGVLLENGWTQEQIDAIEMTAYTGWSRSEGRRLFTEWLDSKTVEEIAEYKWIFTHDDEISMGILEALQSSEIDAEKKDAFLAAGRAPGLLLRPQRVLLRAQGHPSARLLRRGGRPCRPLHRHL